MAVGAGVLAAIPLLSAVYMAQPDNFSLYQPLVIASLWLAARALRGGSARAFVGWPACWPGWRRCPATTACSSCARSGSSSPWDRWRAWRAGRPASHGRRRSRSRRPSAASAVFVLVMAPWWARQLAVFGSLSPSTASGKVLFIRDIGEWNSITTPATLEHLLGMGSGRCSRPGSAGWSPR